MNQSVHGPFVNPAMVTLAREARGLTQTELAHLIEVSQAMMSKIEAGGKVPTATMLNKIAERLQYPESFFFQTDPVFGPGLSEFFHRKRQDVGVKTLGKIHARINIMRMHVARLLRSVTLEPCQIRPIDLDDFDQDPAKIARAVRMQWQLKDGPIPNVVAAIEDAGGIVVRFPFGTPRVDAVSRWVPGLPPMFFVNEGLPTDRERLTLCHELGHLVMHDAPNADMETQANQFAAEFLMPAQDVSPHLDRVTLDRLATLKPYWRVSMQALLYRASELGKISKSAAQRLWIQMVPYRRQEPPELDLAPEHPTLLREILDLHRDTYGYGLSEFAQMLNAHPTELVTTYGLSQKTEETRVGLRVVKTGRQNAS